MENFGLLQLINSLLPSTPPPDVAEEPTKGQDPPAPPAPQNNACLDFFETHDKRAKERKK